MRSIACCHHDNPRVLVAVMPFAEQSILTFPRAIGPLQARRMDQKDDDEDQFDWDSIM